ncbi:uncharacterized protein BJX67DRAFT_319048 [Aspergillus lucknowensis]|uniref:SRR1-like domain-containing protein n=1 Tax=Aspergillus lucknowensis TaxID=176173 RepID=A0ABR4LYR0_9EURO
MTHYWIERPRLNGKDADEWKPSDPAEAAANIDKWYSEGRLLFPRDVLQHVRDQLRKPLVRGDTILVQAFDGSVYDYSVRTGETRSLYSRITEDDSDGAQDKEEKWMMTTPAIRYTSIESLKADLEWSLSRAYCSIGLSHFMVRVDTEPEPPGDLDAGLKFFNSVFEEWKGSEAWRDIKSTVLSLRLRTQIHKVIGMACGEFTGPGPSRLKRHAVQHVLLLLLKEALQVGHLGAKNVACYAQDPAYTSTDQSVLERSGITVAEDPGGFLEMDNRSLVFSCAPNICVKQIIADTVRPPIMFLCTVREDESRLITYVYSTHHSQY